MVLFPQLKNPSEPQPPAGRRLSSGTLSSISRGQESPGQKSRPVGPSGWLLGRLAAGLASAVTWLLQGSPVSRLTGPHGLHPPDGLGLLVLPGGSHGPPWDLRSPGAQKGPGAHSACPQPLLPFIHSTNSLEGPENRGPVWGGREGGCGLRPLLTAAGVCRVSRGPHPPLATLSLHLENTLVLGGRSHPRGQGAGKPETHLPSSLAKPRPSQQRLAPPPRLGLSPAPSGGPFSTGPEVH